MITGALLGVYASAGLSRRVSGLELAQRLIARVASQIRYTAAPAGEILLDAAAREEFRTLSFLQRLQKLMGEGVELPSAWRQAVNDGRAESRFTPADAELLLSFGDVLGKTDVEGQLENCRLFTGLLQEHLASARQQAAAKNRLYITLGVAGGMALALVLL